MERMELIKKDALSDLVYEQMKNMLLNKDLAPGQKIVKKDIADLIGVSQTPVHEAILRLVREGVLEQTDRRGVFVKVFTDSDMRDIFAVRAGMEGIALRLIIENTGSEAISDLANLFDDFTLPITTSEQIDRYQTIDRKFHESILLRSGNSMIEKFVEESDFILRCYHKGLLRSPNETIIEHRQIIGAALAGDTSRAYTLLIEHHMKSREAISAHHVIV